MEVVDVGGRVEPESSRESVGIPAQARDGAQEHAATEPGVPLLTVLRMLKSRAPVLTLATLAALAGAALELVPFWALSRMVGPLLASPVEVLELGRLGLVCLGSLGAQVVLSSGASIAAHHAAFGVLQDLRLQIAGKLARVPLSFFSRHETGHLKRVMLDDVEKLEGLIAHHLPESVAALALPVLVAGVLFRVDALMAAVCLIALVPAICAMAFGMHGVEDMHRTWLQKQDKVNSGVIEFVRGIQVIKTFGLSARSFDRLARSIEDSRGWMERLMRRSGSAFATFQAFIGSSIVFIVPIGCVRYVAGELSLPDLALFVILGPQLLGAATRAIFAVEGVKKIGESNRRILRLLAERELPSASGAAPVRHDVAFRELSFEYQSGVPVLRQVTARAGASQVTAFVGRSGSGKTTLLSLVPRLWDASSGSVEIGGVDVRSLPLEELLNRVSVVFQDVFLLRGSVRDNLRIASPHATDEQLEAACRAARAHDFIQRLPLGYDTPVGERGARLSGGQRQRLSIARALLKDAPILILDEATSFSDAENDALIQEALRELCRGRTVLVIAHRLETIASADHIVVLDQGRVQDQGTHAELLQRSGVYRELWQCRASARSALGGRALARQEAQP